jgi:lipopolysaccharide/colanic/teichoic acid biosynthesis glycosyltransferase
VVSGSLLVLLSPVMLAAWIGARLSTGAPGVYRQVRVGEGGIAFTMLKFRSMRPSEGPEVTASGDHRVTRLGHFLRATSIDELPQLVNVLRGEMTLVGARPETVGLARRYPKDLQAVFRHRPGLTGPAQLGLRRGGGMAASDDVEGEYLGVQVPWRVAKDMDYLSRPTPARTAALIAGTAAYVGASVLGKRSVKANGHLHAPSGPRSSYAHRSPWQLLTRPSAIQIELPASSASRHHLQRQVRELAPGTEVVVSCTALTSHWRTRRFAREAGIDVVREYVAIPGMAPPTCYVENTPLTLRHFFTQVSVLPGGGPTVSALLAAAKQAARFVFPAALIGALAPTRLMVGRVSAPTTALAPSAVDGALEATRLLDVHDMETIVLAMSKDPNAKLTVLLVPRGQSKPALAVKVPTTEVAEASVVAERRLLAELQLRLPPQLLVTIPRSTEVVGAEGSPILVVSALPGSPMSTRYHGWRHVATRSAVEADFKMAGSWLARFQAATAGEQRPIDMDDGVADILASRFADDPAIEGSLARLRGTHARLRTSTTSRTAVHGDFWFGNLLAIGDQISGVIDWESGAISGEPLRDVVRFALTYALYLDRHSPAGGRVAGHRGLRSGVWGSGIEFALDGSGWFSDLFREFVTGGLSRLGADPALWRDAALAGIAEVAATADHDAFARLHFQLFARLSGGRSQLPEKPALEIPSAFAVAPASTESTSPA